MFSNDNGAPRARADAREPDANGHAALLLVESVLNGLVAQSVFSVAEAVEIVDVKRDIGTDLGDTPPTLQMSLGLLSAIGKSPGSDLPGR